MRSIFVVAAMAAACGSAAHADILPRYNGPDAGWVVFSVRACKVGLGLSAQLKLHGAHQRYDRLVVIRPGELFSHNDLDQEAASSSDECHGHGWIGKVIVLQAAPDSYEMRFVREHVGVFDKGVPDTPTSYAFQVRTGRTTYIGEITVAIYMPVVAATTGRLGLADQHDRDMAIAKTKDTAIGPMDLGDDLSPSPAP